MGTRLYGKNAQDPAKVAAAEAIDKALESISNLYAEAEALAIEHGIGFRYEGPSGYGDGGSFDPDRIGEEKEYDWEDEPTGWFASSQSC